MKIGGEGQTSLSSRWSRDQIRREEESGGQSVIGSEDAGNCSGGLEKGTLDRSGRNRKGAGKTNVDVRGQTDKKVLAKDLLVPMTG
jgi:hypothetical protein